MTPTDDSREPQPSSRPSVTLYEPEHQEQCASILAALPQWFGIPASTARYLENLRELPAFVAQEGEEVVGFVSIRMHFAGSAEMDVLAVHPHHHRRGVGRALVAHCEQWLRERSVTLFHVKTLGPSHSDPHYARTRRFYEALGFQPLFESETLWGPPNPALVLVKSLAPKAVGRCT